MAFGRHRNIMWSRSDRSSGRAGAVASPTIRTYHARHAAHTGPGQGWDLDTWDVVGVEWQPGQPKPSGVPADAEYHSGHRLSDGQHWYFTRKAPLSEGTCAACAAPPWSVVCDDVPRTVHVRDDGHVCRNPQPRMPR